MVGVIDEVLVCGDVLAAMVGEMVAAVEAGDTFTSEALEAARDGILAWHRARHVAMELA